MLLAYESGRARDRPGAPPGVADLRRSSAPAPPASSWPGALAEIARHALVAATSAASTRGSARVILVEGTAPRPARLSAGALGRRRSQQLERLGVEVRTGARVTAIDERGVVPRRASGSPRGPSSGPRASQASPLARSLGVPLDRAGRVLVTPDLTHPRPRRRLRDRRPRGRSSRTASPCPASARRDPGGPPRRAQHRRGASRGEPLAPFRYVDKGSFATIGRGAAVGEMSGGMRALGLPRLAGLAGDPHLLPDRLPQPLPRHVPVGLLVPDVPARRAADHGRAAAAGVVSRRRTSASAFLRAASNSSPGFQAGMRGGVRDLHAEVEAELARPRPRPRSPSPAAARRTAGGSGGPRSLGLLLLAPAGGLVRSRRRRRRSTPPARRCCAKLNWSER